MTTEAPPPPPDDPARGLQRQAAVAVEELAVYVTLFAHELGVESLHTPAVLSEFTRRLMTGLDRYSAKVEVLLAVGADLAALEVCAAHLTAASEEVRKLAETLRTRFYGAGDTGAGDTRVRCLALQPADPAVAAQDPRIEAALQDGSAAAREAATSLNGHLESLRLGL